MSNTNLSFGITTIDTGFVRPGFDASHLIIEGGQAAFVDVGTSHTVPVLLEALQEKHLKPGQIRYIIVTHVHLDHSGGTGALLQHLPNAQVIVHPKGARHLISPQRLVAGSTAVYGEELMQTLFGEVFPVPKERVIEAAHEMRVDLNGRALLFLDTPGHANHHVCIVDERSHGIFTGDTFGISYREFDTGKGNFIFPTSSPVNFDPEKMHDSIDLLMSYQPKYMYLTHFGCVADVAKLADDLHTRIDRFVALAQDVADLEQDRTQQLTKNMQELLLSALHTHGCKLHRDESLALLTPDITLNVMGLEVWLSRKKKTL